MNIISRQTLYIICVLSIIMIIVSSANVLSPQKWGTGYKLYNVNGSYWNLMNESGIQNGSLINITYIQLNVSSVRPQAINGTMWYNSTSKTLDCYFDGSTRFCANGTVK